MELSKDRLISNEQEHEYFGLSSTELFFDLCTQVEIHIKDTLETFKNGLLTENKDKTKVNEQIDKLEKCYLSKVKEPLEKVRLEIENVLKLPINEEKLTSDDQVKQLENELKQLQYEYGKEQLFLDMCKQQKNEMLKLNDINDTCQSFNVTVKHFHEKRLETVNLQEKLLESHEKYVNFLFKQPNNCFFDSKVDYE